MSLTSPEERIVRPFTPLPPGYVFVPKGNVYITKNCRKLTRAQNKSVYTVQSDKKTTLGIRVPNSIYSKVLADDKSTAAARAENVRRKDQSLEDKTKAEVLSCFPRIPKEHVGRILRHTLQKRSRRVGRSKEIPLSQVVELAVRAYIRHKLTDYDMMLRNGADREQARRRIQASVDEKVVQWGGTVRHAKARETKEKGSKKVHEKSKRLSPKAIDSRVQKVRTKRGPRRHTSQSHRSSPVGAGKFKKGAVPTMSKLAERRPAEARGTSLAFRPRRTSLRSKDSQIPDEKTVIVISDDEDFVGVESMEDISTGLDDSDASYRDESDIGG